MNEKTVVTLRIKKVYLDQILKGTKKIEFRKNSLFYQRLFKNRKKYSHLKLHYQSPRQVLCKIKSVRLIKRPAEFINIPFLNTEKVFAIYLEKAEVLK